MANTQMAVMWIRLRTVNKVKAAGDLLLDNSVQNVPFCSENSGSSPVTCSREKRYQACPAYLRSGAGEPGNEASVYDW